MDWTKIIEFLLQVLGIAAAAIVVVWQVGRQHRGNLELQKERLKDEQKLLFFDSLSEKIAEADSALGAVSSWGSAVPSALRQFLRQSEIPNFRPAPPRHRAATLLELQNQANRALIAVISTIEYREAIDPTFVAFRYAIARQNELCGRVFHEFHLAILPLLPVDPPPEAAASGVQPRTLKTPTVEDVAALEKVGGKLQQEYLTLSDFLSDLSREAQNRLLGGLFGNRVQERKPLDPSVLVLGTTKEALLRLEKELDLGKFIHEEALPSTVLYGDARSRRDNGHWWRIPWKRRDRLRH